MNQISQALLARIENRKLTIGVIGLGYVGLPLAATSARAGFRTIGFDIDPGKIEVIDAGRSYVAAVSDDELASLVAGGALTTTTDFDRIADCDAIIICVPTPLTPHREPDLKYIEQTAIEIAKRLKCGHLVVLESTSYPGTTRDILKPVLEATGLRSGEDYFLGYSPEREDPGNAQFATATIPKIVAGDGPDASRLVEALYAKIVEKTVPVSSLEVAEAVKITENVFRAVNIALANELKMVYAAMGIDIWEVIEAAKTKPFGFMPFYPGPGLGGHCVPIDPFYLTWKSREHDVPTRFIELAGEINVSMPRYVVEKLSLALDQRLKKPMSQSSIIMIGLAYKKNVPDVRESPSLRLIELIESRGATVLFHDPLVTVIPPTREYSAIAGRTSTPLTAASIAAADAVLIATDHDEIDYRLIAANAQLIVDTRNVMARNGLVPNTVVKA